jgi:hypothetical protein
MAGVAVFSPGCSVAVDMEETGALYREGLAGDAPHP